MGRLSAVSRIAIPLAGVLVLSSCSTDDTPNDSLQIVQNPVAVTAAVSPAVSIKPAGSVFAVPGVKALVTDEASKTLVVAVSEPPSLRIYDLAALDTPKTTVALPGPAERLTVSGSQVLASVPGKSLLAKVSLPGGALETVPVAGQPSAGLADGDATLVSVRDRKVVEVLSKNAGPKTITGQIYSADDVLNTGDGVVVLDKLRTALFAVDLTEGKIGEGLRAGDGAANAVTDDFGRVFVTDARAGALLAFSTTPLLLRQRYPVPGGAYGIAYDRTRGLVWVTLTERNEVVGFDVRGGEPIEKHRFPTVRQPDSVTVDAHGGRVVVGSAIGEGIQVITP